MRPKGHETWLVDAMLTAKNVDTLVVLMYIPCEAFFEIMSYTKKHRASPWSSKSESDYG